MGGAGVNAGRRDRLPTIRQHTRNSETQSDRTVQCASRSVGVLLIRISCAMATFEDLFALTERMAVARSLNSRTQTVMTSTFRRVRELEVVQL